MEPASIGLCVLGVVACGALAICAVLAAQMTRSLRDLSHAVLAAQSEDPVRAAGRQAIRNAELETLGNLTPRHMNGAAQGARLGEEEEEIL